MSRPAPGIDHLDVLVRALRRNGGTPVDPASGHINTALARCLEDHVPKDFNREIAAAVRWAAGNVADDRDRPAAILELVHKAFRQTDVSPTRGMDVIVWNLIASGWHGMLEAIDAVLDGIDAAEAEAAGRPRPSPRFFDLTRHRREAGDVDGNLGAR